MMDDVSFGFQQEQGVLRVNIPYFPMIPGNLSHPLQYSPLPHPLTVCPGSPTVPGSPLAPTTP